ncbi:MAG TPA: FtsX-like permease family protein, partial [Acidobacteriota bacterium]
LVIDINSGKVRRSAVTIKTEFEKLPNVQSVTVSSRVPGEWKNLPQVQVNKPSMTSSQGIAMYFLGIDEQFLKTYHINLTKGNNFLPGNSADSSSVLINETAAKQLGVTVPGELIQIPSANFDGDFSPLDQPFEAKVTGIVKDFNFQSLREPLAPMVLAYQNNPIHSIDYFTIRMSNDDVSNTLKKMDVILHGIDQNHLLEYHFLDKQWDLFYQDDQVRETIFLFMAILAIVIACLGLFGLATYAAEQRTKEIGIRKVLGASVQSLIAMLSQEFLKLVLIAAVLAFPIAAFAMSKWLQGFAYKINISWWIFILSALIAGTIALVTVSYQAVRAAMANPVKSLRAE